MTRIRKQRELLDVRYRVERQRLLLSAPGKPGNVDFFASTMRVELALLHEEDLLRFLADLRDSGNAFYSVRSCALTRSGPAAGAAASAMAARLRGECSIDLITIVDRACQGMRYLTPLLVVAGLSGIAQPCSAQDARAPVLHARTAPGARRPPRRALPDRPNAPATTSPTTRLDGYVSRENGKSTVWVNGEPLPETAAEAPRINDSGRVSVNVESGSRATLRPGQTLDRGTGEVKDVLGNGEIRIERRTER